MTDTPSSALFEADPLYGKVIAHYPSDRFRILLRAALIGAPLALLIGLTVAQVEAWWSFFATIGLMGVIAVGLMWYVLHYWNREIILHEHGFSYREGSNVVFFFYAEIERLQLRAEQLAYFGGLLRRTIYAFTLTSKKGETFTLTNVYRRAAELGTRLTERVHLELKPALAAKLAQGERARFADDLEVSAEGIHTRARALTWDAFGGWRVADRQLYLLDRAGATWHAAPLRDLYNVLLLVDLLRERAPQ